MTTSDAATMTLNDDTQHCCSCGGHHGPHAGQTASHGAGETAGEIFAWMKGLLGLDGAPEERLVEARRLLGERGPVLLDNMSRWLPFVELELVEGRPGWCATARELAALAKAAQATDLRQLANTCCNSSLTAEQCGEKLAELEKAFVEGVWRG